MWRVPARRGRRRDPDGYPAPAMPVSDALLRSALAPGGTLAALPPEFAALGQHYSGKVRENYTRDGERLIAVILTGSGTDGAAGAVARCSARNTRSSSAGPSPSPNANWLPSQNALISC